MSLIMPTRRRLVHLALLAVLAVSAPDSFACQCGSEKSLEQALAQSDVAFIGRLAHSRVLGIGNGRSGSIALVHRFDVEAGWRGVRGDSVQILDDGGSCSYPFRRGDDYLVFAKSTPASGEFLAVSRCSGTRSAMLLSAAERIVLGPPAQSFVVLPVRPEPLASIARRRVGLAFAAARGLLRARWPTLSAVPAGLWLALLLAFLGLTAGVAALARRGRYKSVLLASLGLVAVVIVLGLWWGYATVLSNPFLARFAE